jgi:hypothetical protein
MHGRGTRRVGGAARLRKGFASLYVGRLGDKATKHSQPLEPLIEVLHVVEMVAAGLRLVVIVQMRQSYCAYTHRVIPNIFVVVLLLFVLLRLLFIFDLARNQVHRGVKTGDIGESDESQARGFAEVAHETVLRERG